MGDVLHFGSFSLDTATRVLLDNAEPVRLGNRALDILLLLIGRAGEFVANAEIYRQVWPRTVVAEGNLRVHIAGLRKALGDGRGQRRYIVNVPNRGYSFVAAVHSQRSRAGEPASTVPGRVAGLSAPVPLGRVVGQDTAIRELAAQLAQRRLITLVGAGGIGKTTVALAAVAAAVGPASRARWAGVCFVDLGPLSDPGLVSASLASALGLGALMGDALPGLLAFLYDKSLLIVFDNCEHLVGPVAHLVEGILRAAPGVHVLATSREPLRTEGEWVLRLQPLALPPAHAGLDAVQALQYAAVELFAERCNAAVDTFRLTDSDADVAADICRRLDGIPLAIELAAARINPLGLRGVAAALDDRLALLGKGRRTALPRQQTLRATLDWSFELLPAAQQKVLMQLSVFAGTFTLDDATTVATVDNTGAADVMDAVSELVAKSLLVADVSGDEASFKLLDTTRTYAVDRLVQHGEDRPALQRRHARLCLARVERTQADWTWMPTPDFVAKYRNAIDDVRAALHGSLGLEGDAALGIALTARSGPLFFQLSSTDEHLRYVEQALAIAQPRIDARLAFELNVVAAHAFYNARGLHPTRARAFDRAHALAEQIGERDVLAIARATQWMSAYQASDPPAMLGHARAFIALTSQTADPALLLHRDRMMAPTLHLLGDQRGALACCERGLADPATLRAPFLTGTRVDHHVSMSCIHVRVLWLLGRSEQADAVMASTLAAAAQQGEPVALVHALAFSACPLALWTGRIDRARECVDRLLRHAAERAMTAWRVYGEAFEPYIAWLESGSTGTPPSMPDSATAFPQLAQLMATLHPQYASDAVVQQGEAGRAGWCHAELLRVRGERLRQADRAGAEALLKRSLDIALRDATVPWALRTAASLANLWQGQGKAEAARELLDRVRAQPAERLDTRDVPPAAAAAAHA